MMTFAEVMRANGLSTADVVDASELFECDRCGEVYAASELAEHGCYPRTRKLPWGV